MINTIQSLRHNFFAYRNGMLAEALKAAGNPHTMIFGLNIPQISAIARECTFTPEEIDRMWNEAHSREERLLSLYLMTPCASTIPKEKSMALISGIKGVEEADILSFRVLKYVPYAESIIEELGNKDDNLSRYLAASLRRHIY